MTALLLSLILAQPILPIGPQQGAMADTEQSPFAILPADFQNMPVHTPDRGDSDVLLIVADYLETPLAAELSQFMTDIQAEGWSVNMTVISGGTVEDLRTYLQGYSDISGAILIGNLPRAWYEMEEFGGKHAEFPMDLYLMDLDGIWQDADSDGIFDTHTGTRAPDIWIGRIDAHAIEFGNEMNLLREYFTSNHFYRTGSISVPPKALAFNDDDWSYYGSSGLDYIYSDVEVINSLSQTTAANYKYELATGYEFVHLMSHSSPWGHTFKVPYGYNGTVMLPEIAEINPMTVFVQLFACSNCRWTEPNCLGNWYLFGTDLGLLAIGSTKTGALLDFNEFYRPIGEGDIPGVAFREWFANVGIYDPEWHYGCVLLGDPTLMPLSGRNPLRSTVPGVLEGSDSYTRVSESSFSDCYPVTASYGDDTWVVWLTAENGRLDIAARNRGGDSWSAVYYVDADEYWDSTPDITIDGSGMPWLSWSDFCYDTYDYQVKTAWGNYFENVSVAADGKGYDGNPNLVYTDRMWLVWQVWRRGEGDIMVKALDASFPETYLTGTNTWDITPVAGADASGNVHAAWVEGTATGQKIMWTMGDENGFAAPVEVSTGDFCQSPELVLLENTLLLIWGESNDAAEIIVRTWNGSSWEDEEIIYSSTDTQVFTPTAGISDAGKIFIAWQAGNGIDAEIWQSTKEAVGWSQPVQLVNPSGPAWMPALTDGIIVWSGTGSGDSWDIYACVDGGVGIEAESVSTMEFEFRIISNPVDMQLTVSPSVSNCTSIPVTLHVYDITGRSVIQREITIEPDELISISCAQLPSGVYCLVLSGSEDIWSSLFTVVR